MLSTAEKLTERIRKKEEQAKRDKEEIATLHKRLKQIRREEERKKRKKLTETLQAVGMQLETPLSLVFGDSLYGLPEEQLAAYIGQALESCRVLTPIGELKENGEADGQAKGADKDDGE